MKNLTSYRLLFIAILLLAAGIAAAIYLIGTNNRVSVKENPSIATQNPGEIIMPDRAPNNKTQTLPAANTAEPTIESQPKSASSTTPGAAAANPDIEPQYTSPSMQKYSAQIPKVYRKIDEDTPGINYDGPSGHSEDALAYFKKLSDQGDARGKFIYANRLWANLLDSHYREYLIKGDTIDTELWKNRFEEVSRLYIESASAGIFRAASELPVRTPKTEQDNVDELSWALIADKMEGQGDKTLLMRCEKLKEECTQDLLEKAFDRARFYLDYYRFNTAGKSTSAGEKQQ